MSNQRLTILVVDDAPANIDVIKSILTDDYQIQAAVSGTVALKIAEERKPDLILLDIMMPGMDGFEVCKSLKENPVTTEIPVIFVTGKDLDSDEAERLSSGAIGYIKKPVDPDLLKIKIFDVLN